MIEARPFVKWVGGKAGVMDQLRPLVPDLYGAYHEPFVGGGAMFFALQPRHAYLGDQNRHLINAFAAVRDHAGDLVSYLRAHQEFYEDMGAEWFLKVRDGRKKLTPTKEAARFIFLNKTCYNGLYRENLRGRFNAPPGKFATPPTICDEENLKACTRVLQGVELFDTTYHWVLDKAQAGDFVYFDPPYAPISETSDFTTYQVGGFGPLEQQQLARVYRKLADRGVYCMLSNSSAPIVRDLYQGFDIRTVMAERNVNRDAEKRGAIPEVVILSYRPAAERALSS